MMRTSHYDGTGPEIWGETVGRVTDFVSTLGTSELVSERAVFGAMLFSQTLPSWRA